MAHTLCCSWANIKRVCLNFLSYAPRLKIEKKIKKSQKTSQTLKRHSIGRGIAG